MTEATPSLPRWDMTTIFSRPDGPEFRRAFGDLVRQVDDLAAVLDAVGADDRSGPGPSTSTPIAAFEEASERYSQALFDSWRLDAYVAASVDVDVNDHRAQAAASALRPVLARLAALGQRFATWVGALDTEELVARSAVARDHTHILRRARVRADHALSACEEELAAALHLSGGAAWTKLHADLTAAITTAIVEDGQERVVALSELRGLAVDPDRAVRRCAYEAESAAWAAHAAPLAAALNGVKGEAVVLATRRGWPNPLDAALFDHGLDRDVLDALIAATREALPTFQRYLRAKARLLGLPALAPYDWAAPVGADAEWSFEAAVNLVIEAFAGFSPALGNLAARAVRERWIDAESRAGKRGGGLCLSIGGDESRIRLEFRPRYDSVRTLAHELGHAYHAAVFAGAGRTALQIAETPSTMSETASKFCEELVRQAALRQAAEAGRDGELLAILDGSLAAMRRSVVDSFALFLFEDRLFDRRRSRELSVDELNELMLAAQAETTGASLDPTAPCPWTWAALPHLYLESVSFYNLPYLFGQLFAFGLFARYRLEPDGFAERFDDLLSSTGLDDPVALALQFGIDLRSANFWRTGLAAIERDIDRFEARAAALRVGAE